MKTFSMLSISFGIALVVGTSCNNKEGARSTPVDSTKETGAAPVQYQSGTPDQTTDTTMQTHPMDNRARQDNSNARSMQDAGGNQKDKQPSSNTTDSKTTSGSK